MTAPIGPSGSSPAVIEPEPPPTSSTPSLELEIEPLTVFGTPPPLVNLEPITISARPTPPLPTLPVSVAELALPCISNIGGVAIVVVGGAVARPHPALMIMGSLKASFDLGKCVAEEQNEALARASIERAKALCIENGGTPDRVSVEQLECLVPAEHP